MFLQKYDGKKFPTEQIGPNVLTGLGLPKDRAVAAYSSLRSDGERLGIITDIRGERFVNLASRKPPTAPVIYEENDDAPDEAEDHDAVVVPIKPSVHSTTQPLHEVKRVFITHGRDKGIRDQIEEIVKYGGFDPVVSVKTESLAKPVPLKVLDEMRSCQAAVIHVGIEQSVRDADGNEVDLVNQNVLIEIGAAMALYREKFVLLVEKGVVMPSNLQGLYECRYSGSELSMTATMKLLKAFNDFKAK